MLLKFLSENAENLAKEAQKGKKMENSIKMLKRRVSELEFLLEEDDKDDGSKDSVDY